MTVTDTFCNLLTKNIFNTGHLTLLAKTKLQWQSPQARVYSQAKWTCMSHKNTSIWRQTLNGVGAKGSVGE